MANEKWLADARQLLIDIERIYEDYYSKSYDQCVHDIFNAMRRIVRRNASFGFVEVVHGRWIWKDGCFHCSNCKTTNDHTPAYCEGCGAKMDL